MTELDLLAKIGTALILGLLMGLEREQKTQIGNSQAFAGVRTFALLALTGAVAVILGEKSSLLLPIITISVLLVIIIAYLLKARRSDERLGITTELAASIAFLVGLLVGFGELTLATILAFLTASIAHFKTPLHTWAKNLRNEEIVAALKFALITFVVLPILPDQNLGPFAFFNPYKTWLLVVLISGLSYLSYIAVKILGSRRGIGLTGLFAGFVSSTALTFAMAEQSHKTPKIVSPFTVAILIAGSTMFFRVLAEVYLVNPSLIQSLILPLSCMGLISLIMALVYTLADGKEKLPKNYQPEIKSPISLMAAIKFGLLFTTISLFSKASLVFFAEQGLYITSVISGLIDVDAISLSLASLAANGSITNSAASMGIILACSTNTLVKGLMALFLAQKRVGASVFLVFLLAILAGILVLLA